MKFFNYNDKLAKKNKCTYSFGREIVLLIFFALFIISVLIVGSALEGVGYGISIGICFVGTFLIAIFSGFKRGIYGTAKQQLFVHYGDMLYRVYCVNDMIPKMNNVDEKNDKQGTDGIVAEIKKQLDECKGKNRKKSMLQITQMHNIEIIENKKKYWLCEYCDSKGTKDKIIIPKVYENLDLKNFVK